MVTDLTFTGRLCNRLTQLAGAAVVAKQLNIFMSSNWLNGVHGPGVDLQDFKNHFQLNPDFFDQGQQLHEPHITIEDHYFSNVNHDISTYVPGSYNFSNVSFQCPQFLDTHFDDIRRVFVPVNPVQRKPGVLVHARLGDIPVESSGPLSYYHHVLQQINCKEGYIITDPMSQDHELVKELMKEYNLQLFIASPANQLYHAMGFDHVVLCTGTFSWWIGAFNDAPNTFYYEVPANYAWHAPIFKIRNWRACS